MHIFAKLKNSVTKQQQTHALSTFPLSDCDDEYIKETQRQFGTRLKEHQKKLFSFAKKNSALSEYTCLTNYTIGWEKSEIITTNRRYHQRLCLENWHIDSTHAPLNGDNGGVTSWRLFTPRQKKGSWLMSV